MVLALDTGRRHCPQAVDDEAATSSGEEKKSREQLEAERKAILSQRIQPLEISGFDSGKLGDKAKELLSLIVRLESEKYDLEKQFKEQQIDVRGGEGRGGRGGKGREGREGQGRAGQGRI